jgi:DNA-binding response OmpR family regulator
MERAPCILLLEHEPLLRGMLGPYLSTFGYKVLAGGSHEDAETILGIMGWQWADLVLCDSHLGGENGEPAGLRFHERWRERFPAPPFIFMWGEGPPIRVPYGNGARVRHIAKPFVPRELMDLIRAELG